MILCDHQIEAYARQGMISPFIDHQVTQDDRGQKVVSYGLSSFGYDMRVADEWQFSVSRLGQALDVKAPYMAEYRKVIAGFVVLQPGDFVLCRSVEHFAIPRTITATVLGKSTYARCGLIVNVTPLEAGWRGYVTIELSNTNTVPVKVYANEGIAQVLFHLGDGPRTSYADRQGKYQNQPAEVVTARMK